MTIAGANFGSTQGSSTVKFNGTTATVTSWGASSIAVTVPSGATTGNVVVNVGGTNSNGKSFTVVSAPTITSLSITTGAVGATVVITERELWFQSGQRDGEIQRDGCDGDELECDEHHGNGSQWSDDGERSRVCEWGEQQREELYGRLRSQHYEPVDYDGGRRGDGSHHGHELWFQSGQRDGEVQRDGCDGDELECDEHHGHSSQRSDDGERSGVCQRSEQQRESFTVVSAPSITSLSITTGAVGATVVITGTNFGSSQGSGTVKFNGTAATVTSWSAASITVTVPSGATTGNVVVYASGVNSNGSSFTVVSAPSITSLSITSGAVGAAVTITGTNFGSSQGSSTVTFNGTTATVTSWSATTIAVTVPTGATTGHVVVFASGVNSNGSNFTVVAAPSLSSLSITSGMVGEVVTLTGANFGTAQGSGAVKFNGTVATATSWGATSIVVTVPSGATTGSVVVVTSGVASNGIAFTVTLIPTAWTDADVGAVGQAGSATYSTSSEQFTVNGSGQGVFTNADEFNFVYQPLSGDGSIVARVVSLTGSSSPPAGVMIRETLNTNATSAFTAYRSTTMYFVERPTTGASSTYQTAAGRIAALLGWSCASGERFQQLYVFGWRELDAGGNQRRRSRWRRAFTSGWL